MEQIHSSVRGWTFANECHWTFIDIFNRHVHTTSKPIAESTDGQSSTLDVRHASLCTTAIVLKTLIAAGKREQAKMNSLFLESSYKLRSRWPQPSSCSRRETELRASTSLRIINGPRWLFRQSFRPFTLRTLRMRNCTLL